MSTYGNEDFEELKKIVLENQKILKNLQKKARLATVFTVFKWAITIAIAIGLFTILQPIMQNIIDAYRVLMENLSSLNEAKNSVSGAIDISELLKIFSKAE